MAKLFKNRIAFWIRKIKLWLKNKPIFPLLPALEYIFWYMTINGK